MAVDERTRHELHQRLDEVLGADQAASLMAHLPPTGWGDVVTRQHLDMRMAMVDTRFDGLERRFDELERRFEGLERRFDGLEGRVDSRFDAFGDRVVEQIEASEQRMIASFRGELNQSVTVQSRLLIVSLFTTLAAVAGIVFGVVQLTV